MTQNRELVRRLRETGPAALLIAGGDRRVRGRSASPVIATVANLTDAASVGSLFASNRPDVVFLAHGPEDEGRSVAIGTRRLVAAALRAGVECFVLIGPDGVSEGHRLAERVVRASPGLTRSRLIRVRIGEGISPAEAATRLLRIAAKGRDGAVVTLGRSGGMRVEGPVCASRDAEGLWAELDRIEARDGRTA